VKYLFHRVLILCIWLALRLRYKISVKGLENISKEKLDSGSGVLFLPNHPTIFTDPLLVCCYTYTPFRARGLITEYMYFTPGIYTIMQWINALPIPGLTNSPNSYKLYRNKKSFSTAVDGLKSGENFLVYPAGRTKSTGLEIVGGASGVHKLLKEVPDVNVVLVRMTGLWGSIFSRAITGRPPEFWKTVRLCLKLVLKAGVFFLPRRKVTIEFEVAPKDFPVSGSRLDLNRWLENWYNKPFASNLEKGKPAGEPLKRVSLSPWSTKLPEITAKPQEEQKVILDKVDPEIRDKLMEELSRMTKKRADSITPEMDLAQDLGLDSLDGAELIAFMEEELGINRVHPEELTSVRQVLGIVSGQVAMNQAVEEAPDAAFLVKWHKESVRPAMEMPPGNTIGEVFLRSCDRLGANIACADPRAGVLTYSDLKLRALLLAEEFKKLPGERIGIMLPASIGATLMVLACQLARKVPVMVNWTVGSRHLETVIERSGIEVVLTAWAFIDKLDNVDLEPIHERIILMEDIGLNLSSWAKLRAAVKARFSTDRLLKSLRLDSVDPESPAGILFTSGTEKAPKGVPLSHVNMISNLRATMEIAPFNEGDVVLSMLPPFHSFGFTLTGLMPLLCGTRVVFSPDPTDGPRIAREISRWAITFLVGAPTFLKGVLKAGSKAQLKTLTAVLSGAERVSPEVVALTKGLGDHVQFLEGYGITECSPVVTVQRPGNSNAGVGHPLPGISLKIVHPESHAKLAQGERGLILVNGPNVFGGYLPGQAIEAPFLELEKKLWYITGDLGTIDEAGCLHIEGRLKRFVKIGGEMISLTAIEAALLDLAPGQGWPSPDEGPTVAVCATEIADSKPELFLFSRFDVTFDEINDLLKGEGFSNLVKISKVFHLPSIPITGTGKINYRALETAYLKKEDQSIS
jgi:acyl carrier protein